MLFSNIYIIGNILSFNTSKLLLYSSKVKENNVKKIQIYTDGACSGNQFDTNIGGWGAVLQYGEHFKELYGGDIDTTNNKMELIAIIRALELVTDPDVLISIYSDSSYVVECFRKKWYVNWEKNGWITSKKTPVENQDLWKALLSLVSSFEGVNFFRIKGHLDFNKTAEITKWYTKYKENMDSNCTREEFLYLVKMNNRADELANIAMDEIKNNK